jgi:hypothetical protein
MSVFVHTVNDKITLWKCCHCPYETRDFSLAEIHVWRSKHTLVAMEVELGVR